MNDPMRDPIPFAGCFAADPGESKGATPLAFVGLPCDSQSTFRRGTAEGPARIVAAYDGRGYNATTETGVDVAGKVVDLGLWPPADEWAATAASYRERAEAVYLSDRVPFFVGGDHAVTIPIVEAAEALGRPIHVIQIDAHPDLYPDYGGDHYSHACVAARLLECEHVVDITQYGIRTLTHEQILTARRHPGRVRMHHACDLTGALPMPAGIERGAPVYLTLDMDAFDPAFAPGVAHPVPGGLSPRQVLDFIEQAEWELIGMDVVETNPSFDENDRTAILAARLLHEAMGKSL
jgi:agmatinase